MGAGPALNRPRCHTSKTAFTNCWTISSLRFCQQKFATLRLSSVSATFSIFLCPEQQDSLFFEIFLLVVST